MHKLNNNKILYNKYKKFIFKAIKYNTFVNRKPKKKLVKIIKKNMCQKYIKITKTQNTPNHSYHF